VTLHLIRRVGWLLVLACIATAGLPLSAHHSASAYYDVTKSVTVSGTLAHVDWRNPHVFFYIDSKDGSGRPVQWTLETQSPIALESLGLRRSDIKPGERVSVEVMPARVSPYRGRIRVLHYGGRSLVDMGRIGLP
jgi:hypothetical protein